MSSPRDPFRRAPGQPIPLRPRLLDQVRSALRTRHYSRRTESAYVHWIRQFILFHGKRHPADLGPAEIGEFLTHLATERRVSASTQNQALAALLFLYRAVLRLKTTMLYTHVTDQGPYGIPSPLDTP